VPSHVSAGAIADASLEALSKQDVLKDLRYLHQQVVLTYKAARKIRRAGSINPAVTSAPTTPFGGVETLQGNDPLGTSNEVQSAGGKMEQGDVQETGLTVGGVEENLGGGMPETKEQNLLDGEKEEKERSCGHADNKERKDDAVDTGTEQRDGWEVEQIGEGEGQGRDSLVRDEGDGLVKEPNQGVNDGANVDSGAGLDRDLQGGSMLQEAGESAPNRSGEMGENGGSGGKSDSGPEQIGKVVAEQSRQFEEGKGDSRNGGNGVGPELEGAGGNGLSGGVYIKPQLVDPVAVLRASKAIHNTKKLNKSYYWEAAAAQCQWTEPSGEGEMRVLFGVKLQDPGPNPRAKCDPPPELLTLPVSATFKNLKLEAGRAFQEMYVMMRRFRVTRIEGMGGTSDKAQVAPLLVKERNRKLEREGSKAGGLTSRGSGGKEVRESLPELAADVMKTEHQLGLDEKRWGVQKGETTGERNDRHTPASLPVEDLQRSVLQPGVDRKDEERGEASKNGTEGVDLPRGGALAEQHPGNGVGGSFRKENSLTNTNGAEYGGTDLHLPPSGGHIPSPQEPPIWHLTGTGAGADLGSEARFEAGLENWVVDCLCGTKDDDGERMAECDRCGTWMHTRCLRIRDRDSVPALVVCPRCCPGGQPKVKGKGVKKAGKGGVSELASFFLVAALATFNEHSAASCGASSGKAVFGAAFRGLSLSRQPVVQRRRKTNTFCVRLILVCFMSFRAAADFFLGIHYPFLAATDVLVVFIQGSEKSFPSQSKPSVSKVHASPGRDTQTSSGPHLERSSVQHSPHNSGAPGQDGPEKALGLTWHTKWGRNGTIHRVPRGPSLLGGKKRSKRDLRAQLDGKGKGGGDKQLAQGNGAFVHMIGAPEALERGGEGAPSGVKRKRSVAGGERRVRLSLLEEFPSVGGQLLDS
jgi:hypothetical protein